MNMGTLERIATALEKIADSISSDAFHPPEAYHGYRVEEEPSGSNRSEGEPLVVYRQDVRYEEVQSEIEEATSLFEYEYDEDVDLDSEDDDFATWVPTEPMTGMDNAARDRSENPWIDVFGPGEEAEVAYWNTH